MNKLRKRRAVLLQTQNNIINIYYEVDLASKVGWSAYTQKVIITTRVKMVDEQQGKEGIEPSNMQN